MEIRAGVLSVAGLVVFAWVFSLAAKAASGLVKLFVGLILLTAGAGVVTWEVKKAQRHFRDRSRAIPGPRTLDRPATSSR